MRTGLDGLNCNVGGFDIYSSHACFSSRQSSGLSVCREAGAFTSFTARAHRFMHLSRLMGVFAYSLFICPPERGRVLILMAPQSPRLACNNEDSTFNNLDGQIKKRIQ